MKIFYSDGNFDGVRITKKRIFLVGPTSRSLSVPSWRPDALRILEQLNFDGDVFVPERLIKEEHIDYDEQVEWEECGLSLADEIVAWIPRDLQTMPAFTTNVEFGLHVKGGKLWYGRPDSAPKNRYLDWLYKRHNPNRPIFNNLEELLQKAIE